MKTESVKSYKQAEAYLYDVPKFTTKSTPEMTRAFYEFLGCPGETCNIIHVAGTNGKGSVCTYLSRVLTAHGHKTGVFTSPHLVSMCERFRIDGSLMEEAEFVSLFNRVMEKVKQVKDLLASGEAPGELKGLTESYHPTFFEYLFFMAMLWFEDKGVDDIVLETGLGGRLDATNVITAPVLCLITRIGLDHTEYLGETLDKVAEEKAGIIKNNIPLIFTDSDPVSTEVIKKVANRQGAKAYAVGKTNVSKLKIHENFIDFCVDYGYYSDVCPAEVNVKLPTIATYQTENAAMAILAAHLLLKEDMNREVLLCTLSETVWSGRMEEVRPNLYVDGAHNEDGIEAFIRCLKDIGEKNGILIFGVSRDKNYKEMLLRLVREVEWSRIITVSFRNPRSGSATELKTLLEENGIQNPEAASDVREALKMCYPDGNGKRVYVVGSLYLVGEVKELMMEEIL